MAVASIDGDKGLGPGTDFTFGDISCVACSRAHASSSHSVSSLTLSLRLARALSLVLSRSPSLTFTSARMFEGVNAAQAHLKPGVLRSAPTH